MPLFLITEIEGEVTIHGDEERAASGLTDEEFDEAFTGAGYWLTVNLKKCTFADQQTATREAGSDETLLPQKRFVLAIESLSKRFCGAQEASLPAVTETWFTSLEPPAVGNAINAAILQSWYPVATKTADFFGKLLQKRAESAKAIESA